MGSYSLITQTLTILLWVAATCQKCRYAQKSAGTQYRHFYILAFRVPALFLTFYRHFWHVAATQSKINPLQAIIGGV